MKKYISLILILCLALALFGCGSQKAEIPAPAEAPAENAEPAAVETEEAQPEKLTTIGISEAPEASKAATESPAEQAAASSSNTTIVDINGYRVDYLRCEKGKDYAGTDVINVFYNFTNSNSSPVGFWTVIADKASQHGQNLDATSVISDSAVLLAATQPIGNGESLEIECQYPVVNYTDPVTLTLVVYDANSASTVTSGSLTIDIP